MNLTTFDWACHRCCTVTLPMAGLSVLPVAAIYRRRATDKILLCGMSLFNVIFLSCLCNKTALATIHCATRCRYSEVKSNAKPSKRNKRIRIKNPDRKIKKKSFKKRLGQRLRRQKMMQGKRNFSETNAKNNKGINEGHFIYTFPVTHLSVLLQGL